MGRICPKWSLDIVLQYLQSPSFLPLTCSIRQLTLKTLFLVTLATAFRVSEIHSLAYTRETFRNNQDGSLTLGTAPGFVAKNRRPSSGVQRVTLAPLPDNPSLCPVLALRSYLDRTSDVRGDRTALFLPLSNQRPRLTPSGLSSWIRCLIADAYRWSAAQEEDSSAGRALSAEPPAEGGDRTLPGQRGLLVGPARLAPTSSPPPRHSPPGPVGASRVDQEAEPDLHRSAHELRALASSLSLARGTALKDLLQAVGWRSSTTFARHYLRSVGGPLDDRLPPALSLPGGSH